MFSNNHHHDGHVAVVAPAPPGVQAMLVEGSPEKFYKPPYVGHRGWVGIELANVDDEELSFHLRVAWLLIAPKKLHSLVGEDEGTSNSGKDVPVLTKQKPARKKKAVTRSVQRRFES